VGAAVGVGEGAAARVADKAPNLGGGVPGLGTIARVARRLGGGVAKVNGGGGADSSRTREEEENMLERRESRVILG
jgi:hypothetical protein